MDLFDDIAGKLTGGGGSGEQGQGLIGAVLQMLNNRGGIAGLLQAFQQNGLGDIASSWVGTGGNQPVSPDQVRQVFGNDQIREFATKAGVSPETASSRLADVLPGIVDRLTPGGEVPQGDLMSTGMNLLRGFMTGGRS